MRRLVWRLAQLVLENENLKWAVPEKGGIIWTDNMFIPLGAASRPRRLT